MLTVAHRGYSAAYPENTALAFERAIEAGADFIETDVRLTREGVPVCSHDSDLRRLSGDTRALAALTLEEIRAVALPRGQSVLTLEDALAMARRRAGVMLDVKVTTAAVVDAIAHCLTRTSMTQHVVYGARTLEHVRSVIDRCPQVALLAMPGTPELAHEFLAQAGRAIRYWEDEVTPERVSLVHRAGREVWVTAGLRSRQEAPGYITAVRAAALAECGVDALLVNDPTIGR